MIVLIDDILIYSRSEDDSMIHLRLVFHVLKENQFFAKFRKCEFCLRFVAFVGNIVSY